MLPERVRRCWSSLQRWERVALLAWCLVLTVVCVRSAVSPHRQNVFHIFTLAGQHWSAGEVLYGKVAQDRDVFRYSPLGAMLFAPWSLLPEALANVLWRLVNAGVFLAAVGWWLRELLPGRLARWQMAILLLLLLPLAIPSLNNGQVNPLLIGLLLATVAAVKRKQFTLAGFCVALACWLKVYPLALGLLLILLYRRKFLEPFTVALAVGFVLPFLGRSPEYVATQYLNWLAYLKIDDRQLLPLDYWLRDVRLLFKVWLTPLSAGAFLALQLLTAAWVAALCWVAQRRRQPEAQVLLLTTALACCWMMVFGPSTESSTWIVLAPSLVTALVLAWSGPATKLSRGLLLASYLLLVAAHLVRWFPWGNHVSNLGIQAVGGLIFFAWVLCTALQNRFDGGKENASFTDHANASERPAAAVYPSAGAETAIAAACGVTELS